MRVRPSVISPGILAAFAIRWGFLFTALLRGAAPCLGGGGTSLGRSPGCRLGDTAPCLGGGGIPLGGASSATKAVRPYVGTAASGVCTALSFGSGAPVLGGTACIIEGGGPSGGVGTRGGGGGAFMFLIPAGRGCGGGPPMPTGGGGRAEKLAGFGGGGAVVLLLAFETVVSLQS